MKKFVGRNMEPCPLYRHSSANMGGLGTLSQRRCGCGCSDLRRIVCHQWQQADGCPQDNHWILAGGSLGMAGSECYAKFLLERRCHHLHDVVFARWRSGHHSGYAFRNNTLSVMALRLGNHPYGAVTP